jgi:RsiW-degrading membrane proteinase PrsW (M82 family)
MLFTPDWNSPIRSPYFYLVVGLIAFSAAVIWTCTGKAWIRFHGWVYRAREPKRFWWEVAMDCLIGVIFIGIFLSLIN